MNFKIEYKIIQCVKFVHELESEVNELLNEVHKEYYWSTVGGIVAVSETEGAYAKFYQAMVRKPRIYK